MVSRVAAIRNVWTIVRNQNVNRLGKQVFETLDELLVGSSVGATWVANDPAQTGDPQFIEGDLLIIDVMEIMSEAGCRMHGRTEGVVVARNARCPFEVSAKGLPHDCHVSGTPSFVQPGNGIEISSQQYAGTICLNAESRQNLFSYALRQDFAQQAQRSAVAVLEPLTSLKIRGGDDRVKVPRKRVCLSR